MIGHGYVIGHGRMTFMDARVHLGSPTTPETACCAEPSEVLR